MPLRVLVLDKHLEIAFESISLEKKMEKTLRKHTILLFAIVFMFNALYSQEEDSRDLITEIEVLRAVLSHKRERLNWTAEQLINLKPEEKKVVEEILKNEDSPKNEDAKEISLQEMSIDELIKTRDRLKIQVELVESKLKKLEYSFLQGPY